MTTNDQRRKRGAVAWGLLAMIAAASIGGFLGGRHWLELRRAEREAAKLAPGSEIARLQVENARLATQLAADRAVAERPAPPPDDAAAAQAVRAEAIRALAELRKENRLWPTRGGGARTPLRGQTEEGSLVQFARVFGLTPAQRQQLQAAFDAIRPRVGEALVAHSTVQRGDDQTLVIEITPAPELTPQRESLRAALVAAVGAENVGAYETLHGLEPMLAETGLDLVDHSRTVKITRQPETGRYRLASERRSLVGDGRASSGGDVRSRADLLTRLGNLALLLPGDF